jgi:hypothetical protein
MQVLLTALKVMSVICLPCLIGQVCNYNVVSWWVILLSWCYFRDGAQKLLLREIGSSIEKRASMCHSSALFVWLPHIVLWFLIDSLVQKLECDYHYEAACQMKFRSLLSDDPDFVVPLVYPSHSTKRVLTSQFIHGLPIDEIQNLPQDIRNWVFSWTSHLARLVGWLATYIFL